jgi:hypothetical protein
MGNFLPRCKALRTYISVGHGIYGTLCALPNVATMTRIYGVISADLGPDWARALAAIALGLALHWSWTTSAEWWVR